MTIRSLARLLAVGSLCVFVLVSCFAQTPSTPPVHPRPQTGPEGPPSNPSRQFRATGLEANGGSITAGVYTNSIFGFSRRFLQVGLSRRRLTRRRSRLRKDSPHRQHPPRRTVSFCS